jgi:hypothetical protein
MENGRTRPPQERRGALSAELSFWAAKRGARNAPQLLGLAPSDLILAEGGTSRSRPLLSGLPVPLVKDCPNGRPHSEAHHDLATAQGTEGVSVPETDEVTHRTAVLTPARCQSELSLHWWA